MEKSKMTYLILKNLYNGDRLSEQELGLKKEEYAEILDLMQNEGLITGVKISNLGNENMIVNCDNEQITVSGVNYLMENSIPNREYKMKVSVDETLDGVELSIFIDVSGTLHKYTKIICKPITDIDIETEAFILAAEGLKKEKKRCAFA